MAFPDEPKKEKEALAAEQKAALPKAEEPKLVKESDSQRVSDLEDQLKRLQAEFENYKKRTTKEKETLMMAGSAVMIMKLLPVLDEMEVALSAIHHKASAQDVKQGMEMLYKKFHSVMEKEGLTEMKALGEEFDPYRHEAVRTVEGKEDGKVAEVMKKGYLFRGNVLRHAMVVVTKKKEEAKETKKEGKEAGK